MGIASPDGSSDATAINDHGAIVGTGGSYGQSAFFKLNGQTQLIAPTSGANRANGLNNLDHVVGILGNSSSAFIWVPTSNLPENERVIDLSAVSLAANFRDTGADAINDRDQIVGSGSFGDTGNREALLWQNGKLHRLNDLIGLHPNFTLASAPAINQNGMVLAQAPTSSDGEAYVLVPVQFVEVSPETTDETGNVVEHSDKPKRLPHSNEMIEEPPFGSDAKHRLSGLENKVSEDLCGRKHQMEHDTAIYSSRRRGVVVSRRLAARTSESF